MKNKVGGSIPEEIKALSSLEEFQISNQNNGDDPEINGKSLKYLASLSRLKLCDLSENQIDYVLPSEFGQLTNLESLYLNGNQFKYTIPTELNKLVNLKHLFLNQNRLIGDADKFEDLPSLETLDLSNNEIWVSKNFNLSVNLKSLYMNSIKKDDIEIWTTIGRLSNLEYISISNSNLMGTIPTELGLLTSVTHLQLNNNDLSGTVPSAIGAMTDLEKLDLFANDLTGELPPELDNVEPPCKWLWPKRSFFANLTLLTLSFFLRSVLALQQ